MEQTGIFMLQQWGPLALGWVLAFGLLAALAWISVKWVAQMKEWRAEIASLAHAYHEVVKQNTETTARFHTLLDERTSSRGARR